MRVVLIVLAGWTGATTVAAGLFVALIRGGGGTDLAPLPVAQAPVVRRPVALPAPREATEAAPVRI